MTNFQNGQQTVLGESVADLVDLLPVLAGAYGVVMVAVMLDTGWRMVSDRKARRHRVGAVPPMGVIERDVEGAA